MLAAGLLAANVRPDIVTNYVQAHPDFRLVDGKLYNRAKSLLWKDISGTFVCTNRGGVVVQTWKVEPVFGAGTGTEIHTDGINSYRVVVPRKIKTGESKTPGPKIFIRNYPLQPAPVTGAAIACRALPIENVEFQTEILAAYDFGTPNIVPVVTTNRPTQSAVHTQNSGTSK